MFFNEAFTARRSPLAHVWLAANLEKKLNKNVFVHADIAESCKQIIDQPEGPLALRLTGTLLFGVATIYKKKTDYLVMETRDALKRIKTTYKPTDVDLPETVATWLRPQQLVLEKKITEQNLQLMPANRPDLGNMDFIGLGTSQLLLNQHNDAEIDMSSMFDGQDHSIEVGRGRVRADDNDMLDDDLDLDLDIPDLADQSVELGRAGDGALASDEDDLELDLPGFEDDAVEGFGENEQMPTTPDLENPLTPIDGDLLGDSISVLEDVEESRPIRRARQQRQKKQTGAVRLTKAEVDTEIVLRGSDTQPDIDSITRQVDELPEDPVEFAHATISVDGLQSGVGISALLAPDRVLRILKGSKKRTVAADGDQNDASPAKSVRLDQELENDDNDDMPTIDFQDDSIQLEPHNEGFERFGDDANDIQQADGEAFEDSQVYKDDTSSIPTQNGISKNTLMAAEKLRGEFIGKDVVDFGDLVSSNQRKPNVTMFFEMLVLATKDAIALKQESPYGDIDVTAKQGLYEPVLSQVSA
jgi:cohesin complex subunit SCC1